MTPRLTAAVLHHTEMRSRPPSSASRSLCGAAVDHTVDDIGQQREFLVAEAVELVVDLPLGNVQSYAGSSFAVMT